jgi:hypothetical protein
MQTPPVTAEGATDSWADAQTSSTKNLSATQHNPILKAHFDRAVALLEQKADLAADIAEWRRQARAEGLVPTALVKLAREHLRDAEQQRKAAEAAEVERLYRQGLGLPLFDWAAE